MDDYSSKLNGKRGQSPTYTDIVIAYSTLILLLINFLWETTPLLNLSSLNGLTLNLTTRVIMNLSVANKQIRTFGNSDYSGTDTWAKPNQLS